MSIQEDLEQNIRRGNLYAIIKTLSDNSNQTMGDIMDAIEVDDSEDGVIYEFFRSITVSQLVEMLSGELEMWEIEDPVIQAPGEIDQDARVESDLDADDQELARIDEIVGKTEEAASYDDEGDEGPKKEKRRKKKGNRNGKKKKSEKDRSKPAGPRKKKNTKKVAKSNGDEPEYDRQLAKQVIRVLRKQDSMDEDSALSGENIRKSLEIETNTDEAAELKTVISALKEQEKIDSIGKARGTKYFLL